MENYYRGQYYNHYGQKKSSFNSTLKASLILHSLQLHLAGLHNLPDTDSVVSVSGEQVLSVSRPSERNALRLTALGASETKVGLELVNEVALLEVVDLDTRSSGSAQPVSVRREGQGVDLVTRHQRVEVRRRVKVPQDDGAILSSGGAQGSIRRDGDGGHVAGVTNVISLERGVLDVPDLKS